MRGSWPCRTPIGVADALTEDEAMEEETCAVDDIAETNKATWDNVRPTLMFYRTYRTNLAM